MDLFDLFAKITLDKSEYEQGLDDAEQKGKGFASKLGGGLKTAGKVAAAGLALATTAAAGVTTALAKGIQETASYGDNVDKMSQKLGLSAQAYQQWGYVLQISGASIESMSTGLKTLTNKFDDAVNGSKSAQETFGRLGLTMDDLAGLSREQVFEKTITAFQGMEDSAERAALASDLFGRSGQELAPLFNTSADETARLIDEVNKLGGVMGDDAVKASAEFQDNLTALQTGISGIKRGITAEFLPGVNDVVAGFTALIMGEEGAEEQLTSGFDSILESVDMAVPRIASIITNLGSALLKAAPKLLEVGFKLVTSLAQSLSENVGMIADTALEIVTVIVGALSNPDGLLSLIDAAFQIISKLAEGLAENLPTLIPAVVGILIEIVNKLTSPENIVMLVTAALQLVMGLAQGLIAAIPQLIAAAPVIIQNLVDGIVEALPMLIDAALALIEALVGALVDNTYPLVTAAYQIIFALINGIIQILPELAFLGFRIAITIISAIIEHLPEFISGGIDMVMSIISGIGETVSNLAQAGIQLVMNLLDAILEAAKKLIDAGRQMVEKVKDGFRQKIEDARNWGRDLIQNFIGGIQEKWNALKEKVAGVANTVKSFLGFSEPEEGPLSDFHTYAPDMMELFARGIRDNTDVVRDQLAESFAFDDLMHPELTVSHTETSGTESQEEILADLRSVLNRLQAIEPGTLVGMIAPDMDAALGDRQMTARRRLA